MDDRFDRLEKMIAETSGGLKELKTELKSQFAGVTTRIDANSRQVAGLSKRIDGLTRHQKQFAANFSKRLGKTEAKAQITIEGHEAIRSEMHREFTTLRRDLDWRVQPIEWAVKGRRPV